MSNDYFEFNDISCHGLPSFITGLNYILPTGNNNTVYLNLNSIISGFYNSSFEIASVSNLPNNVYFSPNSNIINGYLQDEGAYHIKVQILKDNIYCEKTLILNCYNPNNKYIYKVNYPINIGFIKYNAPQRLGLS
jgi:hypothetical protein